MYFPQSYHHVQEIQKYNIQDYRPRYVPFASFHSSSVLTTILGWSNFRKQFAKSDKSSACASNAATLSRRRTRVKHAFYKRTTQRGKEEDMERWRVRGRIDKPLDLCCSLSMHWWSWLEWMACCINTVKINVRNYAVRCVGVCQMKKPIHLLVKRIRVSAWMQDVLHVRVS